MNNYKKEDAQFLKNKASTALNIAIKYLSEEPDVFQKFITGKNTFAIRVKNRNTGEQEQCTWAVMEAIYDYHKNNPEFKIDKLTYTTLKDIFATTSSPLMIKNSIDCLIYQMNSEKQNHAPFKINNIDLLNELRNNIIRNYDFYNLNNGSMINKISEYNEVIEKNFGHKVL